MQTTNRLGLNFVNELLHIALTSRVKGTNRPFTHLVHTLTGEWKLVRHNSNGEDPTVVISHTGINIPAGSKIVKLREFPCLGDYALVFPLEDYRPCKLTARMIAGREMPYVIGGGNVYSFIEAIIDQIYQYHITCDRNRNEDDLTFAYDLEDSVSYAPIEGPVDEDVDSSSDETQEPEKDPFDELYKRDVDSRRSQWQSAIKLESPVEKVVEPDTAASKENLPKQFVEALRHIDEQREKDPIRFDMLAEKHVVSAIYPQGIQDLGDEEQLDLNIFLNMVRLLSRKYKYIRRESDGAWSAYNEDIPDTLVFYMNPVSVICHSSPIADILITWFANKIIS